jgi:hypothetical protein
MWKALLEETECRRSPNGSFREVVSFLDIPVIRKKKNRP